MKLKNIIYNNLNNDLEDTLWSCNLFPEDVRYITDDIFWTEVMQAWFALRKIRMGSELSECAVLWYNSEIRIDRGSLFCLKDCLKKELMYTSQL